MSGAAHPFGGGHTGDDGSVPAALAAGLALREAGSLDRAGLTRALLDQRLLVPLLEVAATDLPTGDDPCAGTDRAVAVVGMTDPHGGHVGLAFSGMGPLLAWDPRARPLPTPAREVARAVLGAGGRRLLVDPAGPHRVELVGLELVRLAAGEPWPDPWADPYVSRAISSELSDLIAAGCAVRLEAPGADEHTEHAQLVVVVRGGVGAAEVARRLGSSPALAAVFDGALAVRESG